MYNHDEKSDATHETHVYKGVQAQERHLFLFSDLLLVAKARSGGNFKLKEKVRVSEMWLSSCLDDVAEVAKSHDTSFVMGWPTTNVVASFSGQTHQSNIKVRISIASNDSKYSEKMEKSFTQF
ncbi:GTPase activator activity protein [Halocaridina rubra]|uniref:GTPase activator activity protein n=1 Tax=Halocaridina rubra TaxID=373956 RepID=A0AAN8WWY4_HALRR